MARRDLGQPLFEMASAAGGRQPRWAVRFTMLILLLVVVLSIFDLLPLGPAGLSNRQARKLLNDAHRWEEDSLYLSAAELYQKVSNNEKVKPELRREAAERLFVLSRDHLGDPRAAQAALEKLYRFSPSGELRDSLRHDLEVMRGYSVNEQRDNPQKDQASQGPSADATTETEVARVGNQVVTLGDLLFAWEKFNPGQPPTGGEFGSFIQQYLDMVLLAEAARERGLDKNGRAARDLRINNLMTLNGAMMQLMIERLDAPTSDSLAALYDSYVSQLAGQPLLSIAHVVVKDDAAARRVRDALREGRKFDTVAELYSMDADVLPNGCELGEIKPLDAELPLVGTMPGLGRRLAAMKDGETTGPLRSQRGYHFFKVLGRRESTKPSLDEVRDQLVMSYQKQQLARERQQLLAQLRESSHITINEAGLRGVMPDAPTSATLATRQMQPTTATTESSAAEGPGSSSESADDARPEQE